MMKTNLVTLLATGLVFFSINLAAFGQRNFYVPGAFQGWDPPTSGLMTETTSGSGIYELLVTGLTEGALYEFKILEDLSGDGANWSNPDDPEVTPNNSWFVNVGTTGETTITLDTNDYTGVDDFLPSLNRIIISEDVAEWNAVGDFMTEAGGLDDWINDDPLFSMIDDGNGLYSLDLTIDTPGSYQYRAVNTGSFTGVGTDQRRNDAVNLEFFTFEVDQDVTLLFDATRGAISFETTAVLEGDTNGNFTVELVDFDPIRDNWLENTFIRSEGDLVPDGVVDILDFRQWKDACIAANCASSSQIVDAFNSLPEPSGAALWFSAAAALFLTRRRK